MKTLDQLRAMHVEIFKQNPYRYWAKKFDKVIHIPESRPIGDFGGGTECGSSAALLGNNYAPYLFEEGNTTICDKCLKKIHDRQKA